MTRSSEGSAEGGAGAVPLDPIDAGAVARAFAVEPRWCGMARAAEAVGLTGRFLLHAGPPLEGTPCAPILNSACLAAMLEGWAGSLEEAEELLCGGGIHLAPAQDHGVVVPLAGVVSPSTQLVVVDDHREPARRVYSPLNEGGTQALRLGQRDVAILEHLHWLNDGGAKAFARALEEPLPLLPVADIALLRGDDCHGRTAAATVRIAESVAPRLGTGSHAARALAFLEGSPAFFLNLWMAASALMMRAADGLLGASLLRAAGGNGRWFGIQVSGLPGRWFTARAEPPRGPIDDPRGAGVGAIGDSAVVDCFGLGGMALSFAGEVAARLESYLPPDALERPHRLLADSHPGLPRSRARAALTARQVAAARRTPLVTLGIIDRSGRHGRIGGGIYEAPLEPFVAAVDALMADRPLPSQSSPRT